MTTPSIADALRFNKTSNDGPLAKSRLRRTAMGFIGLGILGLLPFLLDLSPALKTTGLGLLFPGGGFVGLGGWYILLAVLSFALYKASLVAWFGSGMVVAPFIVWLGSAALAGSMQGSMQGAGELVWSAALPIVLALVVLRELKNWRAKQQTHQAAVIKREERKIYLDAAVAEVSAMASAEPVAGERELDENQLGHMRYLYDLALQPVGELKGFIKIDQFQTAAYRYQINNVGYALSVMQCHYTPSFHGYLNEAQQTLIEQNLQRQVWGYWRWESLWGNLSLDYDPAGKDNIMLTGFLGLQVCLYMLSSGDRRYEAPGSLNFIYNDKKSFEHDIHSVIGSIVKNQQEQVFCLYPCEPNWVYTPCNFMGMKALAAYDKLFGTHHFNTIFECFIEKLDSEFTQIDGSVMALRSNLTGFAVPFPFADDSRSLFFNPIDQDRAKEAWAMAKHDMIYREDGELKIRIPDKAIDMGQYRKGKAPAIQNIMSSAREFGDDEVAEAAEKLLAETCGKREENGAIRYDGSTSTSTTIARGMILRTNDWCNAITKGAPETALTGPILTGINYPDVLVAKAYSDGQGLALVLYAGVKEGLQTLYIERLQANISYKVDTAEGSATLTADESGKASFMVNLKGRTVVSIAYRYRSE